MSFFTHTHDTPINIQDSTLIAVGGDHINVGGPSVAGPQQIQVAGSYFANTLKKNDLLHSHASPAALPDSSARIDQPRCMEGTRVELGDELDDWEKRLLDAATMMWVSGGTGMGKTALLLTFADLCRKHGRSVGAFFASNRIASCSDGNRIFATLAIQLMENLPSTKRYISKALRDDPHLFSKGREVQMKKLIVEPIRKVARVARLLKTIGLRSYPTLIVFDGLDELDGNDVQSDIIRIIGNAMKDVRLPLRFLVASRPEPHICEAINKLRSQFPQDRVATIDLTEDALARRDIKRYFRVKFQEARDMHPELAADWPGTDVIVQLVDKASGQFIYATTIMSYIMSRHYSSDDRLAIIRGLMAKPTGDVPYHNLDELYSHIVRKATRREEMLQIMALLIAINSLSSGLNTASANSITSCSPPKLDQILGFKRGEVRRCLSDMHSLIDIGEDDHNIRIYHKSFPDFLLDGSRSHDLHINLTDQDYDRVYSLIICASKHQEIILQILGQVIIAESMSSHVDVFETPGNSTSPRRIKAILGLEDAVFVQVMDDVRLLLEVGTEDQNLTIRRPSFLVFLLDQTRSQSLFVDIDYASLMFRFSSQIRREFDAAGASSKCALISIMTPNSESSVLPRVLSAMHSNKESVPQLQDDSIFDWVYPRLISNSRYRGVILRTLGQVIVARSMPSELDIFGTPANSSSPNRIERILGLKHGTVMQALEDVRLIHEPLDEDQNIKIRHPPLLEFLLDKSRAREIFVSLSVARHTLRVAPTKRFLDFKELVNTFTDMNLAIPMNSHHAQTVVERCKAAGLSQGLDLSAVLLNFILVQYMSLVRSAPWRRHPATSVLKMICAGLIESGFPGFHESDIDASLEAYWDAWTWEVSQHWPTPSRAQKIGVFVKNATVINMFMACLSKRQVSIPRAQCIDILFKGSAQGDTAIHFELYTTCEHLEETAVWFHFWDKNYEFIDYKATVPQIHGPGREGEAQAWEWLYSVCCKFEWLR